MKIYYSLLSFTLFTITVSISCNQSNKKPEVKKSGVDSAAVFILQKKPVNKQISFPAELLPLEKAEIDAKVSGYIKTLNADIGDHVKQGQLLIVLDAPEFSSNYAQANADVQAAHSKLLGSLDTYKRILNASKVEGTVAANELEKVKSQMLADSSSFEAAKEKLNAIAQLKDYLSIHAPFSGVITQRNVDIGTLVGPGTNKPLLVLENTSSLRLRVPIPEAYIAAVPDSSLVHFTVEAQPNITYTAKLSRKAGALNQSNRTETWEFIYPNISNQLKSGMFANAVIKLGRKENSLVVPSIAIVTTLEKRFVIRMKNGKAEWVDVKNGIIMDDQVEIFGNLKEGDTLLQRASDEIKAGTAIQSKLESK